MFALGDTTIVVWESGVRPVLNFHVYNPTHN